MSRDALVPLPVALGIRAGSKVSVINPPRGFVGRLDPLPEGVEFLITAQSGLDVILFFTEEAQELVQRLPPLSRALALTGGLWVCWPERPAEGVEPPVRLSEDFVRQAALDLGMVDNKRFHFDETWVGLRLVWRSRPRPDKPEVRKRPAAGAPTAEAAPPTPGARPPPPLRR